MDKYTELREALESATPGPWTQGESAAGRSCVWVGGKSEPDRDMGPDCSWIDCNTEPNARYIAACHPEAIRALLAERDALREALLLARDRIESERRSGELDPLLRDIEAALAQGQEES